MNQTKAQQLITTNPIALQTQMMQELSRPFDPSLCYIQAEPIKKPAISYLELQSVENGNSTEGSVHTMTVKGESAKADIYFTVEFDESDDMWITKYTACPKGWNVSPTVQQDRCAVLDADKDQTGYIEAFWTEIQKTANTAFNAAIDTSIKTFLETPGYFGGHILLENDAHASLNCGSKDKANFVRFAYEDKNGLKIDISGLNVNGFLNYFRNSDQFNRIIDVCEAMQKKI